MRNDIICPYCIRPLKRLKLLCPRCGNEVRMAPAELLQWHTNGRLPQCKRPGCGGAIASVPTCIYDASMIEAAGDVCGRRLPADIMQYQTYLRFSILGTSGAGKTNFVTAMIHELNHDQNHRLSMEFMDNETRDHFRADERIVYQQRHPAAPTPPGIPIIPQQWRIRRTGSSEPPCSLTIFDGAGEDHENIDPKISRYISGSKELIILIDPLTIAGARALVPEEVRQWSSHTEDGGQHSAVDLINEVINDIRRAWNLTVNEAIRCPTAIVFTKFDTVCGSFGRDTVARPSPHLAQGGFVWPDSDAVDREIRRWLLQRQAGDFISVVENNFSDVRYFGVSSFGRPPVGFGRLEPVEPHRVLDPLLWILAREKIIESIDTL